MEKVYSSCRATFHSVGFYFAEVVGAGAVSTSVGIVFGPVAAFLGFVLALLGIFALTIVASLVLHVEDRYLGRVAGSGCVLCLLLAGGMYASFRSGLARADAASKPMRIEMVPPQEPAGNRVIRCYTAEDGIIVEYAAEHSTIRNPGVGFNYQPADSVHEFQYRCGPPKQPPSTFKGEFGIGYGYPCVAMPVHWRNGRIFDLLQCPIGPEQSCYYEIPRGFEIKNFFFKAEAEPNPADCFSGVNCEEVELSPCMLTLKPS